MRMRVISVVGMAAVALLTGCPQVSPDFRDAGLLFDIRLLFGGQEIHFLSGGDFVVTSEERETGEFYLLRLQEADGGSVDWETRFAGLYPSAYGDRQQTCSAIASMNSICVAGMTQKAEGSTGGQGRLRVVLLNELGDVLWDFVYFDDVALRPDTVLALDDGLRIVGMEEDQFGFVVRPFDLKLDYAGNVLWMSIPELAEGEQHFRMRDAVAAPGGDMAMCGRILGGGQALRLADANGAVVWTREYPDPASAYALGAMPDGGFVMAADRNAEGDEDIVLTRTDANGDILWVLEDATAGFETHARTNPIDLIVDSAGNILLTAEGRTVRYISTFPFTSTDYFLASYSPSGEPQWLTTLPDGYRGLGLAERPGGGYATTGSHDGKVSVLFFDENGNLEE